MSDGLRLTVAQDKCRPAYAQTDDEVTGEGGIAMDELLTVGQVAGLKVPKSWIYGRVHARSLPFAYVKVSHYVRVSESEVQRYLESATRTAGAGQGDSGGGRS